MKNIVEVADEVLEKEIERRERRDDGCRESRKGEEIYF